MLFLDKDKMIRYNKSRKAVNGKIRIGFTEEKRLPCKKL